MTCLVRPVRRPLRGRGAWMWFQAFTVRNGAYLESGGTSTSTHWRAHGKYDDSFDNLNFFICHCLTLILIASAPRWTGQRRYYVLITCCFNTCSPKFTTLMKHTNHWQTQVIPNQPPESIHFQSQRSCPSAPKPQRIRTTRWSSVGQRMLIGSSSL